MARKSLTGFDADNQRVQNVGSGSQPTDAVNFAQLQAALAGLSWHGAVRAASTGNINLSAPGTTIDGVTMNVGDRFLAKDQTTGAQNNVYVFQGPSTAATIATDGQQGNLTTGSAFAINEGTVNGGSAYICATTGTITIGTTAITFNKFGASAAYSAAPGGGLKMTGTAFSVDLSLIPRKVATNVGDGSSLSIGIQHNLATLDVQVQLYEISTGNTVDADVTRTNVNTVTLGFAAAPAGGQYRAMIQG